MLPCTLFLATVFNLTHRRIDGLWMFLNVHFLSLSLYLSYQSGYLHELTTDFYFTYLMLLLGFYLGYKCMVHHVDLKLQVQLSPAVLERINRINYAGFAVFMAAFATEWKAAGWVLPILADNKMLAYYNFPQEFVHYAVVAGIPLSISLAMCAWKGDNARFNWFLITIITVLFVSILARAIALLQIFGVGFMLYRLGAGPRRLALRHLAWPMVALIAFTYLSGGVRSDSGNLSLILKVARMDWPNWTAPFAWIYIYLTTPIENLRYGWSNLHEHTYGAITLGTVPYTFLDRSWIKETSATFYADFINSEGFNTAGLFGAVLKDFGLFGIVYTFALGMATAWVTLSRKLFVVLFSPIWLFALMTSVTNDYFSTFFFFVYFVSFVLLDRLSRARAKITRPATAPG